VPQYKFVHSDSFEIICFFLFLTRLYVHATFLDSAIFSNCKYDIIFVYFSKNCDLTAVQSNPIQQIMQNNNNQKQKQHQDDADPKSNEKDAPDHKEMATSSTSPPPQVVYHSDVCSICQEDVSMMDVATYGIYTCCGKVIHTKCLNDLRGSKLSNETKNSCPWCRGKNVDAGSKEEIRRLRKWTQKNKRWAQEMLGSRYNDGIGVPQDDKQACVLWKLAADQGEHRAQYNLGIMYANGTGVTQSDTLAYKYFQLSAIQGHAKSQYNVGLYYANGTGVTQSDTKAREWWTKAATQGDEDAIENLKILDKHEGKTTTTSSTTATDNTIACFKCNKPQTKTHKLKNCGCKAAKYCNSNCQTGHWSEHKAEHRRIVKAKGLMNTEGEMKDEVTTDGKKETAAASTTHPEEEDVCPICLDALPNNTFKFTRMTCCGNGMHPACFEKKMKSKSMTFEQRNSCCLCRTKITPDGSKELIERLRHWIKKGKG
jgi:TPR repeat protein